jgi:hypothetical protein
VDCLFRQGWGLGTSYLAAVEAEYLELKAIQVI